jgi:hypothetical protein
MPWNWRAHYNDGTKLDEWENNTEHGWKDVDLDRLVAFELIPDYDCLHLPRPTLSITPTMRPIFFRRNRVEIDPNGGNEVGRIVVPCLGWQKTIEGVNVKSFTFYFEDGSVVVTDDDKDVV